MKQSKKHKKWLQKLLKYKKEERVRLLLIEDSFYDGLPSEDISALKELIGCEWIVVEHHFATEAIEIMYEYPDGTGRWIWVPPNWIKRI